MLIRSGATEPTREHEAFVPFQSVPTSSVDVIHDNTYVAKKHRCREI